MHKPHPSRLTQKKGAFRTVFNRKLLQKTSKALVAVMLLAMMLPSLAFAGVSFSGSFAYDGKITGNITFDGAVGDAVYGSESVTLGVYNQDGTFIKEITVTGGTYANGKTTFNVNDSITNSVYSVVYFVYQDSISNHVYRAKAPAPGGGWGGGGGIPSSGDTVRSFNGSVSANELRNALDRYDHVTIEFTGDTVTIPASGLMEAEKDKWLTIKNENGAYILQLRAIDLEALAKRHGIEVEDLRLSVQIKKLTGDEAQPITDAVEALDGNALSAPVDFQIWSIGTDGQKQAVQSYSEYVKRTMTISGEPSKQATVAYYNPDTKSLGFVPGIFEDSEANFWRTGDSVYIVLEVSKQFEDSMNHWAKTYIETLSSKLIIDGVTDTLFEPDRNITRAEFAALVVRSLGLTPADEQAFKDVSSNDWFAGVVGAAAKAGIVDGYEDGTFRPNAQITREELAAMVVRAYRYAGGDVTVTASEQVRILAAWSDANRIVWGHEVVAVAVKAGLMDGMTNTTLETYGQATRAQSAAMLHRFLSKVQFME